MNRTTIPPDLPLTATDWTGQTLQTTCTQRYGSGDTTDLTLYTVCSGHRIRCARTRCSRCSVTYALLRGVCELLIGYRLIERGFGVRC